ncbi:MAG: hypothetical protein KJ077_21970 [Anaerolineae bacterium]|nr:hypothetical protein [Anaerolineae bacterium]
MNNLELRVFAADWNGTTYDLSVITSDLEFDFFDPSASTRSHAAGALPPTIDQNRVNQAIVGHAFNPATGISTLTPRAVGIVFLQVRYLDPDRAAEYHYLIVRIQVHDEMHGWWFGNNSLSVYQDADFAHSQVSLYALFDRAAAGGGIVGDISGHGYVALSSNNTASVELDINIAPNNRYRDRLRGLAAGQATITGRLLGQNRNLTVRCVNLGQANLPLPVLKREAAFFDDSVSRRERYNILFLAEGFTDSMADRRRFTEAMTKLSHDLFDCKRHSPFNLLKDSFNVWWHYEPSQEVGITTAAELSASTRKAIPDKVQPAKGSPNNAYSLLELIQLVGLPTPQDAGLANNVLRDRWNDTGNNPPETVSRLLGFRPNLAVNNVINAWKQLVPTGIPQARDTFYGLQHGSRWGDRRSELESRATMVVPPGAADPDFNDRHAAFARRVHTWYEPRNTDPREIDHDPRRVAPELSHSPTELIINHIVRFADPAVPPADPNHQVGEVWDRDWEPNVNAPTREVNSAGLVCIIANHEGARATATRRRLVRVSLGRHTQYRFAVDNSNPNIRPLNMNPDIRPDLKKGLNTLAHEFGHSFHLGDEYEDFSNAADHTVERADNLTYVRTIEVPAPAGNPHNPDFPTPIDPDLAKWAVLHRIKQADMLTAVSQVAPGGRIRVTLAGDRARRWREARDEGTTVYLRRDKVNLRSYNLMQVLGDHFWDCRDFTLQDWEVDGANFGPHNFNTFAQLVTFMNNNDATANWTFDGIESVNGGDPNRTYGPLVIVTNCPPDAGREHEVFYALKNKQLPVTPADLYTLTIENIPDDRTIVLTGAPANPEPFPPGSVLYIPETEFGRPATLVKTGVMTFMRLFQWDPSMARGRTLSENHNKDAADRSDEISKEPDDPADVPGVKAPCCARYKLIGLYEGGDQHTIRVYRPAGACKMRASQGSKSEGEFCFVCKYLIVNRVDPSKHPKLDGSEYP